MLRNDFIFLFFLILKFLLLSVTFFNKKQIQASQVICGSKDDIVDIDEDHQDHILLEKELECLTRISLNRDMPKSMKLDKTRFPNDLKNYFVYLLSCFLKKINRV